MDVLHPVQAREDIVADFILGKNCIAHILENGHGPENIGDLEGTGQAAPVQPVRRGPGDILAFEEDVSLAGQVLPSYDVENSALPRPVRPNNGMPFSLLNAQIDPEEDFQTIEILIKVSQLQYRMH
jgi:hypothetical protein